MHEIRPSVASEDKTQIAVYVHGTGDTAQDSEKYIRQLGAHAPLSRDVHWLFPEFVTPYQFLVPEVDEPLRVRLNDLTSRTDYAAKALICGFSGGAQFSHRFVYQHPELIHSAVCMAAGCWTHPDGSSHGMMVDEDWFSREEWSRDAILEARGRPARDGWQRVRWIVGCGCEDLPSRVDSARDFARAVRTHDSDVFTWNGAHDAPGGEAVAPFAQRLHQALYH